MWIYRRESIFFFIYYYFMEHSHRGGVCSILVSAGREVDGGREVTYLYYWMLVTVYIWRSHNADRGACLGRGGRGGQGTRT
jgi:hypothetical protein